MADLDDTETGELDDNEFDLIEDGDVLAVDANRSSKKSYDSDLRRMIEDRLERRMLRDELGLYDEDFGYVNTRSVIEGSGLTV